MHESRWLSALGLQQPGPGPGYRNLAEKKEWGVIGTGIDSRIIRSVPRAAATR
jgi:hypothetical protein